MRVTLDLADASSGTNRRRARHRAPGQSYGRSGERLSRDRKADVPGAHSGRNLCMRVLAAEAPRLRLDLGVGGREPLNNQPFFGSPSMAGIAARVRSDALPAYHGFEAFILDVDKLEDVVEVRRLLSAFIQFRHRPRP